MDPSTLDPQPSPDAIMTASAQKKQKTGHSESSPSDLSNKPIQVQRRRVWRACECCRRKKIKCDGQEPVCSQCTQTNSTCNWIQTKDRAALSRHYVQELEQRLVQMEGLLTQVGPVADLFTQNSTDAPSSLGLTTNSQRPSSSPHASTSSSSSFASSSSSSVAPTSSAAYLTDPNIKQEPADPDQFGQLALDGHGQLANKGTGPALSTTKPPLKTEPPEHNLYFPPTLRPSSKMRALPGADEVEYPPRDLADKLVTAYFVHFHHTLPAVDSSSFLTQYRRLMDEQRINTHTETGFAAVVFAVFACAARFVDDDRLKNDSNTDPELGMGMVYYERAMILYYIGQTATQLAHVQCFVLLASFLASVNSLPQSWLMCGQAVRIAQDLGLHRSPRHLMLTPIDKETRRKVWWCVYGLDRMLAVALGRPLGIEDADCDVELALDVDDVDLPAYFAANPPTPPRSPTRAPNTSPTPESLPRAPSLMKGFNALTCLFRIAGQVLRSVYALDKCKENLDSGKMAELQASVDRLDKLLTDWCDKLPAPFKSDPRTSQQVSLGAILCSCYYAITITLHRNFLPTSSASRSIPRSTSVAKAVTASRSCIFLAQSIKDVIPPSHYLAFFSQYLFSSAIIILLCIMHATDETAATTAMNEVSTSIECLGSLEAVWPGAKKCKELLKELADVTSVNARDVRVLSPGKRDRLSLATDNVMGSVAQRKDMPRPSPMHRGSSMLSPAATPSSTSSPSADGSHYGGRRPSFAHSSSSSMSRKRSRVQSNASDTESTRLQFHNTFSGNYASPASLQAQSPMSMNTPSSLAYEHIDYSAISDPSPRSSSMIPGESPRSDMGSSYTFNSVSSNTQYDSSARWSTPRNAGDMHNFAGYSSNGSSSGQIPDPAMGTLDTASIFSSSLSHTLAGTPSADSLDSGYLSSYGLPFDEPSNSAGNMHSPLPTQFDLTGLPFSGLDFLQNFTSFDGSAEPASSSDGDALWSNLGSGAFKMGPDLPFSLVDGN